MKVSILLTACASAAMIATVAIGEVGPNDVVFTEHGTVVASLTGVVGDPENGAAVFKNRKKGNCLACHANSDMMNEQFHGEIGPSLDGAGLRWEEAELRGLLTNANNTYDGTMMPSFYVDTGFTRVLKKFDGQTNLTAQEVEDVLAYIQTLTE